jgi:hypothetical protein
VTATLRHCSRARRTVIWVIVQLHPVLGLWLLVFCGEGSILSVMFCGGVCRCFSQDVLGPSQPAGNKEGGAAQGEGGVQ